MAVAPKSLQLGHAVFSAAAAERGYYSISEAAALLGVSRISIWRWIRDGKLPASRLGHRTTRIKREDLELFLSRNASADFPGTGVRDPGAGPGAEAGVSTHLVQFYETDPFLVDAVAEFIGTGLRAGDVAIVIATEAHREALEERLRGAKLDVAAGAGGGRYLSLDAAETLATFMVDGAPDPARFREIVAGIIGRATKGRRRARIFGEMVALLVAEGNHAGAIHLEQLWNDLQKTHPFSLFCAYPIDALGGAALAELVDDVCANHSRVVPAESYTALLDPDDRLRVIALLQQKARSLEAEVADRKQAEQALDSLLRISRKLHASLELETLLDHVVEEARQLVGAEGGYAGLRTPEGMVCRKYFHKSGVLPLEYCWPPGHGLPGWLLLHKAPYVTNDALADDQGVRELCERFGVRSALCTPIPDGAGEILGFFELHNKADGAGFTEADQEKLMAVARIASIAIQNAHLYRETRDAVRARDEFLAIASHELRTPLTTVAAHAQLMLRRLARDAAVEPAASERAFRAISDQAGKLSRLVEQLLDVARLEDGKFVLDPRGIDLRELVERVAAAAAVRATQRIVVRAPDPTFAVVDPLRLDQALTNLLDNAIKYGAHDRPIDVELAHRPGGWAEIAVRDRGPGIPEELRAELFERFFQAHPEGYRSGMGLGLYLSRQIAELHGGEIRAEFPPDGGTRFVVRLPTGSPDPG